MLIMPSNKLKSNLNKSLLVLILIAFTGCGSFNSSSLVSADGIYSNGNKSETQNSSSKYYENYFKEKALELDNDFVFSDSINSNSDFITSNQISYSANNAAWGQIPDTKDYIIYNSYRDRYFGYGYYGQMYPPYGYGYGYGYPYYSYFAMRNWYRYGWGIGYYPFYVDFYPYGWWGRTMPFGYRNRYSSYGAYGNNVYDNYLNRDYNSNVSYNDGRRGSSSNVVIYGNGKSTSANGSSKNNNSAKQLTYYNVGRAATVQDDNNIGNNENDTRIRTYKEFVKSNNSNSVTRNRTYARPEMGIGLSGSAASGRTSSNGDQTRRYYNNPNSVNDARGSKPTQYDWGLGGRNRSTSNGSQARSYSNPGSYSNTTSGSTRSYSTPSSTSSSFSRPSSPPSGNVSSSSSGGGSSVGSGGRGSR